MNEIQRVNITEWAFITHNLDVYVVMMLARWTERDQQLTNLVRLLGCVCFFPFFSSSSDVSELGSSFVELLWCLVAWPLLLDFVVWYKYFKKQAKEETFFIYRKICCASGPIMSLRFVGDARWYLPLTPLLLGYVYHFLKYANESKSTFSNYLTSLCQTQLSPFHEK